MMPYPVYLTKKKKCIQCIYNRNRNRRHTSCTIFSSADVIISLHHPPTHNPFTHTYAYIKDTHVCVQVLCIDLCCSVWCIGWQRGVDGLVRTVVIIVRVMHNGTLSAYVYVGGGGGGLFHMKN